MTRYTKKDADGRYYIESVNGKLESDKYGHTYGESIDRFAELENADVVPRSEIAKIFEEIEKYLVTGTTLYGQCIHSIGVGTFAELKKKYTEN